MDPSSILAPFIDFLFFSLILWKFSKLGAGFGYITPLNFNVTRMHAAHAQLAVQPHPFIFRGGSLTMASREKKRNGYSCSLFVQLPPDYIKCGVCWNVLRDPQLTECCGRNVCKTCIVEGGPCPLSECGTPHVKASFNRKCRNDIDDRKVYCSIKNNGCQWVDKLEKLEAHLEECGFVEEACQYCRASVQRQSLKHHEETCMCYPIECKCGTTYERQDQSLHLKSCIYTSVKCPFNIVGCTREVLNKDLQQHHSDCLLDHYTLIAKLSQDIQAKVETTKCLVQQKYEDKISQLDSEIEGLAKCCHLCSSQKGCYSSRSSSQRGRRDGKSAESSRYDKVSFRCSDW